MGQKEWRGKREIIDVYDAAVTEVGEAGYGAIQKTAGNNTSGNFKLTFAGGPTTAAIGFNPTPAQVVGAINAAYGSTVAVATSADPLNTNPISWGWLEERKFAVPAVSITADTTDNGVTAQANAPGTLPDPDSRNQAFVWVGQDGSLYLAQPDGSWTQLV